MPKELEERINTRDALRRKEYLKAQKIIREQKLKEEVMAVEEQDLWRVPTE